MRLSLGFSRCLHSINTYILDPTNQGGHLQPTSPIHRVKVDTLYKVSHSFFFVLIFCQDYTIPAPFSNNHVTQNRNLQVFQPPLASHGFSRFSRSFSKPIFQKPTYDHQLLVYRTSTIMRAHHHLAVLVLLLFSRHELRI